MEARALIEWPHVFTELVEFIGIFLAAGAVGFGLFVVPRALRRGLDPGLADRMLRTAAGIGLVGALIEAWHLYSAMSGLAARQHVTLAQVLTTQAMPMTWAALVAAAIVGFALALARAGFGFRLAAIGIVAGTLRTLLFGQWERAIKPVHLLAGGLWIGTLFALVVAGLGVALSASTARERRGAAAMALVHAFSPLALAMGILLAFFGVILIRLELPGPAALVETPYGRTLLVKLTIVACVFALGAWNFRRHKPRLGDEGSALALRRSARGELALALAVLIATAILAGMPSPKEPPAAAPGAPATEPPSGAPPAGN